MKSYNHLFEKYISDENYHLAVRNATKHKGGKKRKYRKARYIRDHAEELKPKILDYAANFENVRHTPKIIYDGIRRKQRSIIVPTMEEQVIHHMVINVLKPIFMRSMYEHSYGSIPGRGAHLAKATIEKWIRKDKKSMKYCLKMDIQKFFDSIPHDILKRKLSLLIHDEKFLQVLYTIIDVNETGKGIPLGFYTSQWLANWYLEDLDHYIKETLGAKYYVRYMDDMVIFGGNKRELHQMRAAIQNYLKEELGLTLKPNWQVFLFDYVRKGKHIGRDLDFMGFRFFRDRTTLRRTIMLKATRKARRVCRKRRRKTLHDVRQMLSYLGWIDCTDTYAMYKKRIKPFVSFQALKRYAGRWQREENRRNDLLCGTPQKTVA